MFTDTVRLFLTERRVSIDSDSQFVAGLITLLCHLTIYLKKNSRFGRPVEDRGEFIRNFYLQTVIILALLFGGTETTCFTFKNKWQPWAPYGEYGTHHSILELLIYFFKLIESQTGCTKKQTNKKVSLCLHVFTWYN